MKSTLLIILLLLFFIPTVLFGQGKDSNKVKRHLYISANAGIGMPSGIFGNSYYGNSYRGYANIGFSVNLLTEIPIRQSYFGIAGIVAYNSNSFDLSSFIKNQIIIPTSQSGGNYNMVTILPGVYGILPFNGGGISFHFLVGGIWFSTPALAYSGTQQYYSAWYGDNTGNWVITSASRVAVAIDYGMSLKCLLSKRLFWLFNVDFTHSELNGGFNTTPQFTLISIGGPNLGNYRAPTNDELSYSFITQFNFTTGLGYRF